MKTAAIITGVTAFASTVAGHATWQQLWINGEDQTCVREPQSNSPIQDVTSNDLRCNAGPKAAASTCAVAAGDTVTIEMHQHDSRGCTEEAIGGAHYGPVLAYMSKVEDAAAADGSDPWFKIFQNTWAKNPSGSSGSDDFWGTKDLNTNCGTMDLKIPADLAPGDYLLRAEAIALHAAGSSGGAQHYMSCYQITVSGSGTSTPEGVSFPGAYSATDPGLLINIYQSLSEYVAPGPAVIEGGSEAVAGNAGSAAPTKVATQTATSAPTTSTAAPVTTTTAAAVSTTQATPTATTAPITTTAAAPSTLVTSTKPATTSAAATGVALWGQCGGKGFTGSTTCAKGTCKFQNDYYSQCLE